MIPAQRLNDSGQDLWLDGITRDLLNSGTIKWYVDRWSITGLTSNLTAFNSAIRNGTTYDTQIYNRIMAGQYGDALFGELAIEDVTRAADLLLPIFERTSGRKGCVSIDISPLLARDTVRTLEVARCLFIRAARLNLLVKVPGTKEGLPAIEELIFGGIPVNITSLFSPGQLRAAAEAFVRGMERRVDAGLHLGVASVASVALSPWESLARGVAPDIFRNNAGLAVAKSIYRTFRNFLNSSRWQRLLNYGVRPPRLLWACANTCASNGLEDSCVEALADPFTIRAVNQRALQAFTMRSYNGDRLSEFGVDGDIVNDLTRKGIDLEALAAQLQDEAITSLIGSWLDVLDSIMSKGSQMQLAS